jgi:uncharacterized surface protein with fasciclin (FAS1) repeats
MTNILNTIANIRELSIFAGAIKITSLDQILNSSCEFTVFAPNNLAFAQLSTVNSDILTKDILSLTAMLSMHIIAGKFGYQQLLRMNQDRCHEVILTTIDSSSLHINISDGMKIGNSTVLSTDGSATNGVIHVIDCVVMSAKHIQSM